MDYLNNQKRTQSPETLNSKDKENDPARNNAQVSGFISEGNPNTQESPPNIKKQEAEKQSSSIAEDQQSAQMVKQAIKDDQALAAVAGNIHVTVKDGAITLDGQVSTQQQMNLATNTATAIGVVDEVSNHLELKPKKVPDELKDLPGKTLLRG